MSPVEESLTENLFCASIFRWFWIKHSVLDICVTVETECHVAERTVRVLIFSVHPFQCSNKVWPREIKSGE